jgi:hypothetical protein
MFGLTQKKHLVKALLAFALATGVVLVETGTAGAVDPPGPVACNSGARTVTAYPNNLLTSWYGGRETVYFSPDLYKWNGSSWAIYDPTAPWLQAVANGNGVLPWHLGGTYYWVDSRTNQILEHWTFSVAPGSYKVVDYYNWASTGQTLGVLATMYNRSPASYCTIS